MARLPDTAAAGRGRARLQKHTPRFVTHAIEAEKACYDAIFSEDGKVDWSALRRWHEVASSIWPYVLPKQVDLGAEANGALLALARAIDASLPSGRLTTNKEDNPKLTQGITDAAGGVTPVEASFVELDVPRVPEL